MQRRPAMADIRVERKKGGHAWIWIVLAVVVLIAVVVLLDRAGYIDLPVRMGMDREAPALGEHLAAGYVLLTREG
jgi:preprotein translocase subunit SecG